MNIHEAARRIINSTELPELRGPVENPYSHGLCSALRQAGAENAYVEMANHMEGCGIESSYLPEQGVWTEQRLNILCLLACTEPEDFSDPMDLYEY